MSQSDNQPLDVLGGITAEQFLSEYWQKKPLLVRQALPEIADLLLPDDVMNLALEDEINARLIKQKDKDPSQWTVKSSPLVKGDFQKLPKQWTLLVQAVENYSFDLAELWKKFDFIPQWRRDDVMVSYAPQGGSVGQHFDFYDVFLVQGYGHRRWQLGQMCDENTEMVPRQPLKLLPEMQVHFDEVLAPGDLLYVPPGLAHYGVAEDECMTFSFGCRMPNAASIIDRFSDHFAESGKFNNPLLDIVRQLPTPTGEITQKELDYLKGYVLEQLQQSTALDGVIAAFLSEAKFPEHLPEPDELEASDLVEIVDTGYELLLEPASRLLYNMVDGQLQFWGNGEALCVAPELEVVLRNIADGQAQPFNAAFQSNDLLEDIAHLLNESILMLLPPAE
ncbi:50S ribosomal protein L16 3-hydroxylase [Acinetobacter calcoaceticus]|uniref:50S ribosomal protein L16 3-hydroxylase n=1 Tax=Acinetobacter calcoaceticus TaxID=471 RepID=A0A4R1XUQ4_ACICA|nr:50S ribosomal protein L16 3-hydroxylase [Acinetobacter calcoaceticus]